MSKDIKELQEDKELLSFDDAVTNYHRKLVDEGFIEEDGTPIKCQKCGSSDFRVKTTDAVDLIVIEQEAICNNCGNLVGVWCAGYW